MKRALILGVCGALATAHRLPAQCPNGTPPPCERPHPLDEREWLILPFENVGRDPSLDVVRDASVTLLYLEMSRWTDIRVVDDARTLDLLRAAPEVGRHGLEPSLRLARRAGAGKLVLGTLLPEGSHTNVVAAVYDVRSGSRLRSPHALLTGTDSLSAVFRGLAEAILSLPLSRATDTPTTTSTEALRAYAAGMAAGGRGAFDTAAGYFEHALEADSGFAMAHFRLSMGLRNVPGQEQRALPHFQAAQRLAARLPMRERSYIQFQAAAGRGDRRAACDITDRLLAWDSLDAVGWWQHAACLAGPPGVAPVVVDERGPRFSGDWNAALAADRRSLELDPTFYAALRDADALLTAMERVGCAIPAGSFCPDGQRYVSAVLMDHDSLAFAPYLWAEGRDQWRQTSGLVPSRLERFRMARELAGRFVADNPESWQGRYQAVLADLGLGDVAAAERDLDAMAAAARYTTGRAIYFRRRLDVALAREQTALAASFVDSILGFPDPSGLAAQEIGLGTVFGRYSLDRDGAARRVDSVAVLRQAWLPVFSGAPGGDFALLAARYAIVAAAQDQTPGNWSRLLSIREISRMLSFQTLRLQFAVDTAAPNPIIRFQARFARGHIEQARAELAALDAELAARPPDALDDGAWLLAAESHVLLGDSAAAYSCLRDFVQRWPRIFQDHSRLLYVRDDIGTGTLRLAGRAWLLYGDLAMAAGDRVQARRAYRFVVGLWDHGEPPVQPLVARARAALDQLGN